MIQMSKRARAVLVSLLVTLVGVGVVGPARIARAVDVGLSAVISGGLYNATGSVNGFARLSSTSPAALGTAAVGTGTTVARADHVHAMPRLDQVGAPNIDVPLANFGFTGARDPSGAQDFATLNFLDQRRNPNYGRDIFEDFTNLNAATTATATLIPGPGFYYGLITGTGSQIANEGAALGTFYFGGLQIKTGTTTTGAGGVDHIAANTQQWIFHDSTSKWYWTERLRVEQLSNGTDTYTVNLGFYDAHTLGTPANGAFFQHLNGQANWQCDVCAASSCTTVDSGIAVTTSFVRFEEFWDGTNEIFKLNGAQVCSISTHVPTVVLTDGWYALNSAGVGAGRIFHLDWIGLSPRWSAGRN